MRRTRLAAAAGVAALTLGATAAVAEDPTATQTVTITVTTAPRTLTGPNDVSFTTTTGTGIVSGLVATNSIGYTNPGSRSTARVNVTLKGTELPTDSAAGQLTLSVVAAGPASAAVAGATVNLEGDDDTGVLITGIPADTTETVNLTFLLSSGNNNALADTQNITLTLTYTIADN